MVWIKIDETLPWIELEGTYTTRREAKKIAREVLGRAEIKIVETHDKERQVKAVAAKH